MNIYWKNIPDGIQNRGRMSDFDITVKTFDEFKRDLTVQQQTRRDLEDAFTEAAAPSWH